MVNSATSAPAGGEPAPDGGLSGSPAAPLPSLCLRPALRNLSSRWDRRRPVWAGGGQRPEPLTRLADRLRLVLVAAVVTVLDWGAWARARPGLDISWQAGTAYAFVHHLQWGPQVDFTYGPYGFAGFLQPFYLPTAVVGFLYILVVTWALATLLVTGMRRYWGLLGAGVVTWALLGAAWAVGRSADFAPVVGLGLGFLMVQQRARPARDTLALAAGTLLGFSVLVKLSDVVVLALIVVAVPLGMAAPWGERARTALLVLGGALAAFLTAWLAAGQAIGNLLPFARASVSLAAGYSANMGTALAHASIAWWGAVGVLVLAVVAAATMARHGRRARAAVGVMTAIWCWAAAKDGFVAGNHYPGFFRLLLAAVALMAVLGAPRKAFTVGLASMAALTMAMSVVPRLDPAQSARAFVGEVVDMASPGRFAALEASGRRAVARGDRVGPVAPLLDGHTIAVEPWEDLLAWDLPRATWDPEPVLQSYSAFTSFTDRLDASFISSAAAPERLLYQHRRWGFAGRDPSMDPPATTVAVYCHYVQLAVSGQWQVLQRVPDRCGHPHVIGVVHTHFGEPVRTPVAPGRLVVASFSLRPTLADRIEGLLVRPPLTYITTWSRLAPGPGRAHDGTRYLFVTGTAADEHVLEAPPSLGYSPRFWPVRARWAQLSGDGYANGQGDITVTFRAIPIAQR